MAEGKFITLEGGEGVGKSTQAELLCERLRKLNIDVLKTREPGGTPRAETIRDIILSGKARHLGPFGETVLFYAARESHLELAIRPALARGTWVVCDRFNDSTKAYQGAAGGVPSALIETLDAAVVGSTRPHLTLLFDLPPEEGLRRAARRAHGAGSNPSGFDYFERKTLEFHRSLREAFLALAKAEPERIVVIDASRSQSEVSDTVWRIVRERFKLS